jgi:hypothetical protein
VYYWLAKAYSAQGEFDLADQSATQATQLSEQAKDGNWPVFAIDWALIPLYDANTRGRTNPRDPEIPKRIALVRERAQKIAAANPAKAGHILGQSYYLEGKAQQAQQAYTSGLEASKEEDLWRLELQTARSELVYNSPELWGVDVKKPKPQVIEDADRASESPAADASSKAYALALAAQARIKASADSSKSSERDAYRLRAIEQLRQALQLDARHRNSWFWRELIARQLKTYIDLQATRAEDREAFRKEAVKFLDEAIGMAPDKRDKDRIGELRRTIMGPQ